jgi:isocitrate dehydrogenase kinase/phosphatase
VKILTDSCTDTEIQVSIIHTITRRSTILYVKMDASVVKQMRALHARRKRGPEQD